MVFQSYALYPHMTVAENMGYGLKVNKVPKAEIRRQVEMVAKTLQLSHLLDRKPKQLSGGQRQRVAIGRAIVRNPRVFMFDEPLSNLDAELRVDMRMHIARLHQELKTTMVYVTHDQVEAMTLADKIVVMNYGKVEHCLLYTSGSGTASSAIRESGSGSARNDILRHIHWKYASPAPPGAQHSAPPAGY